MSFTLVNGFYCFESKHEYDDFIKNTEDLESYIKNGDLEYVKSICKNKLLITNKVMNIATEYGQLDIIKYFHNQNCPLSYSIMYYGSNTGNLNIIKYAHENGVNWSRDGDETYIASSYGFLDILQYVHQNGCIIHSCAIKIASQNGHLDCLQYIIQSGKHIDEYYFSSIIRNLIENNHLNQIKEKIDNDSWWNDFFCKGYVGIIHNGKITSTYLDSYRNIFYYFEKYPDFAKIIKEL
jgi:hypothetical protein